MEQKLKMLQHRCRAADQLLEYTPDLNAYENYLKVLACELEGLAVVLTACLEELKEEK